MFRVDWIEKYVSRIRPWQVVALWGPVMAWFVLRVARDRRLSPAAALPLFAAGVLAWTLLEYWLHRMLFHFEPDPGSELQRDLAYLIHGVHHEYPYDRDRLVMPPIMTLALALLVGLPLHALLGPHRFAPVFSGLLAGYLWYDLTHYAVHHGGLNGAIARRVKRHHLRHHFQMPDRCFGVTTPLWDLVFGTYPRRSPAGA